MDIQNIIENLDFSSIGWMIATPIIFSIIDIVTGFIQAVINHDVQSSKMRVGLLHKILICIVLLAGFVFGLSFNLPVIPKFISGYIVIMEVISIFENLKKAGIDFSVFIDFFKLTKKGESDETK